MKAAQAAVQTALQIQLAAVGIKVFGAICNKMISHCMLVYIGGIVSM